MRLVHYGTSPNFGDDLNIDLWPALARSLFADPEDGRGFLGIGTIVIGLAAVIIGETILPARSLVITTAACIVGALLYRFFIALALNSDFIGLQAQDLNLVTAVLVAFALLVPAYKRKLAKLLPAKPKAAAVTTPKEA